MATIAGFYYGLVSAMVLAVLYLAVHGRRVLGMLRDGAQTASIGLGMGVGVASRLARIPVDAEQRERPHRETEGVLCRMDPGSQRRRSSDLCDARRLSVGRSDPVRRGLCARLSALDDHRLRGVGAHAEASLRPWGVAALVSLVMGLGRCCSGATGSRSQDDRCRCPSTGRRFWAQTSPSPTRSV